MLIKLQVMTAHCARCAEPTLVCRIVYRTKVAKTPAVCYCQIRAGDVSVNK